MPINFSIIKEVESPLQLSVKILEQESDYAMIQSFGKIFMVNIFLSKNARLQDTFLAHHVGVHGNDEEDLIPQGLNVVLLGKIIN